MLEIEWSTEQIAAHVRMTFPDRPTCHVCQVSGAHFERTGVASDQRHICYAIPHQRIEHRTVIVIERR